MPEFVGALIYDSSINLAGLERDRKAAIDKLHSIGTEATKTFKNDIARGLAKSVRPENFAADVAQAKALLGGIAPETRKIFERELGRNLARKSLQPFIDETKTLTGQLKGVLASRFDLKNLVIGAASGFGLATLGTELVRFGKDAVVFAAQYETSLAKIKTISGGIDLSNVRNELKSLSQQVPQDLLVLSEGLFNIIGSGVKNSADAFKVLDVSAKAATAGFTDTKFAADAIVFVMNAFGKSAADAEEIANILFKTVDLGKIEFKDLASNIGEVANPAKAAGVSLNELGKIIAASTIGGTPISEAFTGIKNLMSSIIAPAPQAEKALRALSSQAGVVGIEFSRASLLAAGGLSSYLKKIQEITGGDPKKLEQLFPEKRALRIAQIVTDNLAPAYQGMGEEFDNITGKSGEMLRALEIANATAENQAKILKNNLGNAIVDLGGKILNVLKPSIEGLNDIFVGKETSILGKIIGIITRDVAQMNAELAQLGESSLPLTNEELQKIVNSTKAVSDNVQTLASTAEQPIFQKTIAELKDIVALGGEQAEKAREELKKREEIEDVIKRTTDALELLRAASPFDKELTTISQKFEKLREEAHGSLKALRLLAQQEGIEINKAVDSLLKVTAEKLFALAGGEERFKKQLDKKLVASLPANFLLDIKSVDLKKTALAKLPDQIRAALSDIGFPFKSFLIDLEKTGIATESELVQLADLFDRRLGDVTVSLFEFINKISDPSGTALGGLLSGFNLFSTAASIFGGILGGINRQNDLDRARHFQEAEEARREEEERLLEVGRQLTEQYEKLRDALSEFGVKNLQDQFLQIQDSIKSLIGTTRDLTEEQIRQILSIQGELKRVTEEINALIRSGSDVPQELLDKQKELTEELARLGGSLNDLTAEQILRLNELFKESGLVKNALENFGKFANDFSGLIDQLNFGFDVLNVDSPIQKLSELQKAIQSRFKAIIPTTEAGIRDLITQGLAALEAGGDTLLKFLASRDLEELTAGQFRDLLQLLNQLANEAKSKVDGINDIASESVISQVRLATFEQTNALIDNTVTMRIVLTNILDAERQMLELARRNVGLTGSGGAVTGTHDRFFFFNDGVISETTAANLSQLQRRMYNDAAAQAGGKGLS